MSFAAIDFGSAAAENEVRRDRDLLLGGFLDDGRVIASIRDGTHFVVIGQKGSGKSAIALHLELLSAEPANNMAVTLHRVGNFPFASFQGLFNQGESPEARYVPHWEFLLLTALTQSLVQDKTLTSTGGPTVTAVHSALVNAKILPSKDLRGMATTSTKNTTRINLPGILQHDLSVETSNQSTAFDSFLAAMKEAVSNSNSLKNHFLLIDGLDDILTKKERQHDSILGLIEAASLLNQLFDESGNPYRVVVFCRTDMWDRLDGTNKNKILQDCAISIRWAEDPRVVSNNDLVRLVNLRASKALGRPVDVFAEYFAGIRELANPDSAARTILLNTRHLPRDMVMAMQRIQQFSRGMRPTYDSILAGLRAYSQDYLIKEIEDELSGYLTKEETRAALRILQRPAKPEFLFADLLDIQRQDSKLKEFDLEKICEQLFVCSAIGNVTHFKAFKRYTFKFRNDAAQFDKAVSIAVHPGLYKALNIPFDGGFTG